MDQGAVIVGRVPSRKSKGRTGLTLVEGGFPGRPPLDLSKYFKVIDHKPSIVDEDLNEIIQREGTHQDGMGGSGEAAWFYAHKGYSEKL